MKSFRKIRNKMQPYKSSIGEDAEHVAEASPMIKPPKNEFGTKADAFAHAKKTGAGKVFKKSFTHPLSGQKHVSYVVREDTELAEAIKLNSKVKIHAPGKDYHGKVGHVGEIRKGLHDKAPKTYTVDYDYNTKTGNKKSIQLDKSQLKMHNEAEIDEAIKKPNATTRHLRQYPVSDKDVAKPVKKPEKKKPEQGVAEENILEGAYEKSEENKHSADVAKKQGDMVAHHLHMADHHDNLAQWHTEKGRHSVADSHAAKAEEHQEKAMELKKQGVAEAAFKDPSPMMKDSIKQDRIRSLKNLIAVAKVKGIHHKVKEYESELKKLKETTEVTEAGAFSYGAKPPRKGSVAYNALMKRKEQDKNRVKEIEAIGTKNHHVGVAKVTKAVAEGYTGRETKDGTWRVFKDGQAVAVAGPFKSRDEAHAWIKKHKQGVSEAKDTEMYKYIDQSGGHQIKGKSGTYVGYTHSATKGKGANILKHHETKKYYAAGGSSSAFTAKTTLHDTPQAAAKAYHKGNLAEQDEKEAQEYDYEGDMARSDLRSIIFNAQEVHDMLEPNTNLPEWVQAKITKAEDYMSSVRDYMKAENENL